MSNPLSDRTAKLLALVPDMAAREVITQLFSEPAALHGPASAAVVDRVRFAVIKVAMATPRGLEVAKNLYKTDTRDLLMSAGFGSDILAHEKWCALVLER